MLIGEYKHKLDDKKRVSLPIKFRQELGKKIVVTRGLDNCLFIYTEKGWKNISEKIGNMGFGQAQKRGFNRYFISGASLIDIDSIGRILIPEYLRDFAKIDGNVVITGVFDRVEVWNEKLWEAYKNKVIKDADTLAENLGEIGAI